MATSPFVSVTFRDDNTCDVTTRNPAVHLDDPAVDAPYVVDVADRCLAGGNVLQPTNRP